MRLDQAIAARFPQISRRQARLLLSERRVLVNDRPVSVASREVSDTDQIVVVEAPAELSILAGSDEWIVVDKPPGLPTQPVRGRSEVSLEELLRLKYRSVYLVHRIDRETSGVVIFARTAPAAARLSRFFASGEMRKLYLARVALPLDREITIDSPIDGRTALTIVRPWKATIVEAEIKTGRTHQIRIHLASLGMPVDGDRKYGGRAAERLMLHAWKLDHPEVGAFEAPVPQRFTSAASAST